MFAWTELKPVLPRGRWRDGGSGSHHWLHGSLASTEESDIEWIGPRRRTDLYVSIAPAPGDRVWRRFVCGPRIEKNVCGAKVAVPGKSNTFLSLHLTRGIFKPLASLWVSKVVCDTRVAPCSRVHDIPSTVAYVLHQGLFVFMLCVLLCFVNVDCFCHLKKIFFFCA